MIGMLVRLRFASTLAAALVVSCSSRSRPAPAPAPPPAPIAPARVALEASTGGDAARGAAQASAQVEDAVEPSAPYRGHHKLGANRVTDNARTGSVSFVRRDGALFVDGRVERASHWLSLRGRVEPEGERAFTLIGVIEGVPDMAWAGEPLRERRSDGRFRFEQRKGRPYFRLYEVDGRECVCQDDCGNDFCYIDIELAESSP